MTKRLCITPCGAKKIWDKAPLAGPTIAKDVYIGAFANACQAYAERYFTHWMILSAKHGFLWPSDVLESNYDVAFNSPSELVISRESLRQQIAVKGLDQFDEIVVLGGKKYARVVRDLFAQPPHTLCFPLDGCKGIGYMLQRLNESVRSGVEIGL
ncbi:MAG: DUF6884 domain-containing protein [Tumebacillaceae bacterium]